MQIAGNQSLAARYFLIIVYLLLCQIDSIIPYSALRRTAGDEEDAVVFGGGIGATDDVVQVFFCTHRTVVDLEDDEVRRYAGTLQFASLERLDLQAVVNTQAFFLCVSQFRESST